MCKIVPLAAALAMFLLWSAGAKASTPVISQPCTDQRQWCDYNSLEGPYSLSSLNYGKYEIDVTSSFLLDGVTMWMYLDYNYAFFRPDGSLDFADDDEYEQYSFTSDYGKFYNYIATFDWEGTPPAPALWGIGGDTAYYWYTPESSLLLTILVDPSVPMDQVGYLNFTITPVPEPAAWLFMLVGLGFVGGGLRLRRSSAQLPAKRPGCSPALRRL